MKFACYVQIPLLSGWEAFATETQTKPYHLWLNPAGLRRANGDKAIDKPPSTLLFVKHMLFIFFLVVAGLSQISVDCQNELHGVKAEYIILLKSSVSGKFMKTGWEGYTVLHHVEIKLNSFFTSPSSNRHLL